MASKKVEDIEIVWQDPPSRSNPKRKGSEVHRFFNMLSLPENRDKWAVYPTKLHSSKKLGHIASHLRCLVKKRYPSLKVCKRDDVIYVMIASTPTQPDATTGLG